MPGERMRRAAKQGVSPREGRRASSARSAKAGRHAARHAALKRLADGSDRSKPERTRAKPGPTSVTQPKRALGASQPCAADCLRADGPATQTPGLPGHAARKHYLLTLVMGGDGLVLPPEFA